MRRLLLLVGAIVFVDTMFFSAITPLLPHYAERFDLSKTSAGILAGSYAAGAVFGTVPSGWLAMRVGSRRTALVGLTLMAVSSVAFAFGHTFGLLTALRFLDGVGGACAWTGGMGWLLSVTPSEQRGATIGATMSAALAGVLLGPVVGAVAQGVGPELPFTTIGVFAALLALVALRMPAPPAFVTTTRRPYATALRDRRVRTGAFVVLVPALVYGTVEVLAPLALDRLGASGLAIGATFLVAAAIEGVGQIGIGRATDRVGRGLPIRIGFVGTIVCLVLLPLPTVAWLFAIPVVLACVFSGILNTPAMTLLSDGVEEIGLDYGLGFAIVNLVWGGGQVIGAIGSGALAATTSDTAAYLVLAGICTATLLTVTARLRDRPAVPTPAA
ncbi:MAG TPA: MFS transporter [Conexibacter sp.]|jgi:MFS family permease|nr:MFS transporter [Conexibacter sp.]